MKKLIEYKIDEELEEEMIKKLFYGLDNLFKRPIKLKGVTFTLIDNDNNEMDYKLSKGEVSK